MNLPLLTRTFLLAGGLLIQLGVLCFNTHAAPGDVDLSFDPGSDINGSVQSVLVQPDGKLIIAGQFNRVRGLARTNLARLNADGSGDPTFNSGTVYTIGAIALQADGKVLVAGVFSFDCFDEAGCFPVESIHRLNMDGSHDASFAPAEVHISGDPNLGCSALVVQPDGKVLVGGKFYGISGTNLTGLARLHLDGTVDNSFSPPPGWVSRIALQANGDVLVAGGPGGSPFLARLNSSGQLDTKFNPTSSLSGTYVSSLALQPDGQILIGGFFTSTNAIANGNGLVRLHANGSLDTRYRPVLDLNDGISDLALQADGKVLVAGSAFTTVDGPRRQVLVRLHPDGSLDKSFGTSPGAIRPAALVLQPNDQAIIVNSVVQGGGQLLVRLTQSGAIDPSFDSGRSLGRPTAALALQSDGKILIGGPLVTDVLYWGPRGDHPPFVSGTHSSGRERLNSDGKLDETFSSVPFSPDLAVWYPDNCPGQGFFCQHGALGSITLVQSDGKLILNGYVETTVIGEETFWQDYKRILVRYHPNGSLDSSFVLPANTAITAAVQEPDGKILMGGYISWNGVESTVARLNLDGTLDPTFELGHGPDSVTCIARQADGRLVVGGRIGLARFNHDGTRDGCFNPVVTPEYAIRSISIQSNNKVVLAGGFTSVNGVARNGIARINPDGSLDATFDPGPDGAVSAMVVQPDGNILIGGDFSSVNGVVRPYLARLMGAESGPSLRLVAATASALVIGWPASEASFTLQQCLDVAAPVWVDVNLEPLTVGLERQVTIPRINGRQFFRLSGAVEGGTTNPVPAPVPPRVTSIVAGDRQVAFTWVSFAGATEHRIQRATNYEGPYVTIARSKTNTYTDTNLINSTLYYYQISCSYDCGESASIGPFGQRPQATLP